MQPRLTVGILVLQAERLVRRSRYVSLLFQDDPNLYSCRTTANYRPYRSSHAECRCGRSGNSRFPDMFRLLRWSSYVPVPTVRSRQARCRYRYTFRRVDFLQEVAAVPDEAGFLFEAAVCFQTAFAYPSAQRIVGVGPSLFRAVFF